MFRFRPCHTFLSHKAAREQRSRALNSSWATVLYRDEVIYTHSYDQTYFESTKGYGKKVTEVKECHAEAPATAAANHRERRKLLRTAHKELAFICSDQPGLLSPKTLFEFTGRCFSRDEINGLLSSIRTKISKPSVDNEEDPDHVFDFNTRMVDNLNEKISETSDLSLFCFYSRFFQRNSFSQVR